MFAPILKSVLNDYVKKDTLMNGFKACGIYPWNFNNIDFSKCLGGSPSSAQQNSQGVLNSSAAPAPVMSYDAFKNRVGNEIIANIESNTFPGDIASSASMFTALQSLKEFFTSTADSQRTAIDMLIVTPCTSADDPLIAREQISSPNVLGSDSSVTGGFNPQPSCSWHVHNAPVPEIPEENPPAGGIDLTPRAPKNSVVRKMLITSLDEILVYPETPKRKGCRTTKRQPFVISSEPWKRLFREEEDKKAKIQQDKEDRAEQRKIKKTENEKKGKKTRGKKGKPNISGNGNRKANSETITEGNTTEDIDQDELSLAKSPSGAFANEDEDIPGSPGTLEAILSNDGDIQRGLCFDCGGSVSKPRPRRLCDICDNIIHLACISPEELSQEIVGCTKCKIMAQELDC